MKRACEAIPQHSSCYHLPLMATVPHPYLSPQQYLAQERRAEFKSQYFQGEMFAMAGASREHNLIVANLVGEVRNALKDRRCEVYPSDMRVKVAKSGLYTYPDATVVCSEPEFEDDHFDTLTNPTVLFETLRSPFRIDRILRPRRQVSPLSRNRVAQRVCNDLAGSSQRRMLFAANRRPLATAGNAIAGGISDV